MSENLQKFLEIVSENEELRDKLNAVTQKSAVIEIAKEAGYELTEDDFGPSVSEVSDEELDDVVGGSKGKVCACMVGGGGKAGSGGKTCACVAYGQGDHQDGRIRCLCSFAGTGQHPDCIAGGYS